VFVLLRFKVKQKIFEVDNIKIGGQPGQLPTVMFGNLFYKGMPEVKNHKTGEFDRKSVLQWIETAETLSEKTGVPHFLDVMAMFPQAMERYLEFVSEKSQNPFLIDGANPETRVAGLKTVREMGFQERTVFNAISPTTSESEVEAIREAHVKAAIILAHNEMDFSPEGRVTILKGFKGQVSLLKTAKRAGIEKTLIDTIVFDVPSIAYAAEAITVVKERLGLPAGCSPANATYDWRLSKKGELSREGFIASNASAHALAQFYGADFLIYGPVKQAKNLIMSTAVNDAIIAYHNMRRFNQKPLVKTHPIYKIF
jgi:tetrahydromethanopterin S-methyltransferase subunit H